MHGLNFLHSASADMMLEMRRHEVQIAARHSSELAALTRKRAGIVEWNANSPEAALVRRGDPNAETILRRPLEQLDHEMGPVRASLEQRTATIAELDRRLIDSIPTANAVELQAMRAIFKNTFDRFVGDLRVLERNRERLAADVKALGNDRAPGTIIEMSVGADELRARERVQEWRDIVAGIDRRLEALGPSAA